MKVTHSSRQQGKSNFNRLMIESMIDDKTIQNLLFKDLIEYGYCLSKLVNGKLERVPPYSIKKEPLR